VMHAKNDSERDRLLLRLLKGRDGSAIVYASTRKNVDAITALLNGMGTRAVGYHAGLPDRDRKRIQDEFMSGQVGTVVATNAFGMGIDKGDVRIVVHYNMPGNLEAYYQEAGRAGRDGGESDCVLLHAHKDKFTHEYFINSAYPPRRAVEGMMRALRQGCSHDGLFSLPMAELARVVDDVKDDRQAASAVRVLEQFGLVRQTFGNGPQPVRVRLLARPERISRELGERPAELHFLRALWKGAGGEALYRGAELDWRALDRAAGGGRGDAQPLLQALGDGGFVEWRVLSGEGIWVLDRETPLNRLPVDWRALDERKRREEGKLRQMQAYAYTDACRRGFVLRYFGDPAAMKSCGACDNCLGTSPVGGTPGGEPVEPASRAERVRTRLWALRQQIAERERVPPGVLWPDALLEALAQAHPRRPEGLLEVPGVDEAFANRFGRAVLDAIAEGLDANRARVRTGERRSQRQRDRGEPPPSPAGVAPPTAEERERYGRLRALRTELAKEAELPAYCVFADKTLVELAKRHPTSLAAMRQVPGVGPAKIEKYGEAFLEVLRQG
jgi:ATP-dependent DNA helicase RecQ